MSFYPAFSYIANITNEKQAVVTFTAPHDFTLGENVGFRVTAPYGMFEINNMIGRVLSLDTYSIRVDIESTLWNPFVTPVSTIGTSPPVCVPSSSGIIPNLNPATINLQDSFDNRPS